MNLESYIFYRSNKQFKAGIFVVSLLIMAILGFIDFIVVWEVDLLIFYLAPIFLVAWFVGKNAGAVISVMSAITWFIADESSLHHYSHPVIPFWNMTVILCFFLTFTYMLAALHKALEEQKELAHKDYLTEIANRRFFYEWVNLEIDKAKRNKQPLTMVYMDIDNFKTINDCFSHSTGDDLLRLVAKIIQENIRSIDIVSRLGGDEFVILLPGIDANVARNAIERVQKILIDEMNQKKWPVTFSIGAATFINPPQTVEHMIKRADA